MSDQDWIRPALAANRSLPEDLLIELAGTHDEHIQMEIIRVRLGWPSLAVVAPILAGSPHAGVRGELARATYVPDDVLVRLAGDAGRMVRIELARRPFEVAGLPAGRAFLPAEAYRVLAGHDDPLLLWELLGSPDVPAHLKREIGLRHESVRDLALLEYGTEEEGRRAHERLLSSADPDDRRRAARSRRFRPPVELLADEQVRLVAAERVSLDPALARTLVADDDPAVRRAVAVNPDLPRELVEVLADDPDLSVRRAVVHRPFVPLDLLDRINDGPAPNAYRVDWLWDRRDDLELVTAYSWSSRLVYRRTVAQVPGLSPATAERLARDEDYRVRVFLAGHNGETAPIEVLEEVLWTWDGHSSAEVARNPRVPDDLIDRLSRAAESRHRWRAVYSGRLTARQRARLADDPDPWLAARLAPPLTRAQLRARLADPSPEVRADAARREEMPEDLIRQLWESR